MAITAPAFNVLQQIAILATGNATNAAGLNDLQFLATTGGDLNALINTVNAFMGHQAAVQGGSAQVIQSVSVGSGNSVAVSAGLASFNLQTPSLENKINAVLHGLGSNQAAVAFVDGGNTYLVYGDGVQGTQNSDIVVQLIGVQAGSLAAIADGINALVLAS